MPETYPGYGWETNRGYPTPEHIRAIDTLGPDSASPAQLRARCASGWRR